MHISGNQQPMGIMTGGGAAAILDVSHVITRVTSTQEARALPKCCFVGDKHGGLTFTDAVAYILENRSNRGWHEVLGTDGQRWTIIHLNR
jgi:hypothetical protein